MSQIGSFPQVGMKIKNIWNHHLVKHNVAHLEFPNLSRKAPKSHKSQGTQNQAFPHQSWFPSCHLASFWSFFQVLLQKDNRSFFGFPIQPHGNQQRKQMEVSLLSFMAGNPLEIEG